MTDLEDVPLVHGRTYADDCCDTPYEKLLPKYYALKNAYGILADRMENYQTVVDQTRVILGAGQGEGLFSAARRAMAVERKEPSKASNSMKQWARDNPGKVGRRLRPV